MSLQLGDRVHYYDINLSWAHGYIYEINEDIAKVLVVDYNTPHEEAYNCKYLIHADSYLYNLKDLL